MGKKGMLISLESCDGGGKSTQSKLIIKYFEDLGKKIKYLHFPMYGHNMFSEMVTNFLQGQYGDNGKVDPIFVSNIYSMDRYMYKDELLKDLEENDVLLVDRYVFSNVAYQTSKIKNGYFKTKDELRNHIIHFEFSFLRLPYPDLILFLDVPIIEIENRLRKERIGADREYLNGKADIHENDISYQEKVRDVYLSLISMKNFKIVNTNDNERILSPNEIFDSYKKHLIIK